MQPLSARCMRFDILLRFRMGRHSLPAVLGRHTGTSRAHRPCRQCDQHAVGDACHIMMAFSSALQCVRPSMLHC